MSPVALTLAILALAIVAFISNRVAIEIVAVGVAVALWLSGVLDLHEALAGFGDPTVVFIACLFVVSEALESTGVTAWVGKQVIDRGSRRLTPLVVTVCVLVALLTALISVNGAVAALIGVVVVVATKVGLPPSKMLIPLAFSAHAGSLLALTGTPVNIIVSEAAVDAGARPFAFFEYGLVGVPLLIGTVLVVAVLGRRLLPTREPSMLPQDVTEHARTLGQQYAMPEGTELISARHGVTEVVVSPRSELIGMHLFPGMVTPSGDLVVVGLQRGGEDIADPDSILQAGDTLLLTGTWGHLQARTAGPEVLVVDDPAGLRRSVPLGTGARRAVVILVAMVGLLASSVVPAAIAGLLAASAIVLTGVLTPAQVYRSVSWTTVILVAGMIPLSTAFTSTGTADLIAGTMLGIVGDGSPHLALLGIVVITMTVGQVISNTATVLIMVPIATAVANDLEVSILPFLMALAVAGASSFLTPVATPANTMILEPGGYRFGDYWRIGLPLMALFLAIAVFYVPLIWSFR